MADVGVLQYGGAISVGIDRFKVSGAGTCGAGASAVPAQVQISDTTLTNNVASDSGGAIYVLSGAIGLTVTFYSRLTCL